MTDRADLLLLIDEWREEINRDDIDGGWKAATLKHINDVEDLMNGD